MRGGGFIFDFVFLSWFLLSLFWAALKLLAFISSDLVYVSFEIAVLDKPCNDELLKSRDGAGIKAEAAVELGDEPFRQDHITDTERG